MAFMSRLGTVRSGMLPAGLLITVGRFGRRPGCLGRALQLQHNLSKLLLAQPLEGIMICTLTDPEKSGAVKVGEELPVAGNLTSILMPCNCVQFGLRAAHDFSGLLPRALVDSGQEPGQHAREWEK